MVILILLLWSLCAVYITGFLYQRNMKVAATAYAALYVYLTLWVFVVSGWDFAHFGFVPDRYADLYSWDYYHSFTGLIQLLDKLPSGILLAIVGLCVAILTSTIALLVISSVRLVKAIARVLRGKPLAGARVREHHYAVVRNIPARSRIYLEFCRLNN